MALWLRMEDVGDPDSAGQALLHLLWRGGDASQPQIKGAGLAVRQGAVVARCWSPKVSVTRAPS